MSWSRIRHLFPVVMLRLTYFRLEFISKHPQPVRGILLLCQIPAPSTISFSWSWAPMPFGNSLSFPSCAWQFLWKLTTVFSYLKSDWKKLDKFCGPGQPDGRNHGSPSGIHKCSRTGRYYHSFCCRLLSEIWHLNGSNAIFPIFQSCTYFDSQLDSSLLPYWGLPKDIPHPINFWWKVTLQYHRILVWQQWLNKNRYRYLLSNVYFIALFTRGATVLIYFEDSLK